MSNYFTKPLPIDTIRALSQPRPRRALCATFLTWSLIIGAMAISRYVSDWHFYPIVYVVTVMWIGNQQHSLLIQMHDGAHRIISRNAWVNDWVAELFCAWPMFFRMAAYRENHRLHHRYANTERDPDFLPARFPKSRQEILRMLLRDVTGLNTVESFGVLKRLAKPTPRRIKLMRLAYYAALAVLLTVSGLWKIYLLYWIVPLFTWLKVVLRIRAIADHAGVETRERPFDTRVVIPNLFDKAFLAPRNCSYHLGHHLYQSVPWFNLKRLNAELMKDPEFEKRCRITRGFWRLLFEFPWQTPNVALSPRLIARQTARQ